MRTGGITELAGSMPGLVLPNGFEIEIYDAVSPINDRVVYSEGTVDLYSIRS